MAATPLLSACVKGEIRDGLPLAPFTFLCSEVRPEQKGLLPQPSLAPSPRALG